MSNPTASAPHSASVTRAAWPDPCFMADLAAILRLESESAARRWVAREGIPHVRIGRRLAVRAATLRDWLAAQETEPAGRAAPPPVPKPPAWAVDLLLRGRRRGLSATEARQGGRRS